MAPPTDRTEILARFRRQIAEDKPIVGAGAGMSTFTHKKKKKHHPD
jgi:predicted TIM-barrel enzyme